VELGTEFGADGTFPLSEKIIAATQGSHYAIENVPTGTCEEIGFETKPAARNGTDAQSSAILSSAFISVLTTAALLLA